MFATATLSKRAMTCMFCGSPPPNRILRVQVRRSFRVGGQPRNAIVFAAPPVCVECGRSGPKRAMLWAQIVQRAERECPTKAATDALLRVLYPFVGAFVPKPTEEDEAECQDLALQVQQRLARYA